MKKLLLLSTLFFVSTSPMGIPKYAKGDVVQGVNGPARLNNKVMRILGTTKEIWGFEDVEGSADAFGNWSTYNYLMEDHPSYGVVYYVQGIMDMKKECVHESWIERKDDFDEDTTPVIIAGTPNADGVYEERVTLTLGDLKRQKRLERDSSKYDKKRSVNCMSALLRCLGYK